MISQEGNIMRTYRLEKEHNKELVENSKGILICLNKILGKRMNYQIKISIMLNKIDLKLNNNLVITQAKESKIIQISIIIQLKVNNHNRLNNNQLMHFVIQITRKVQT